MGAWDQVLSRIKWSLLRFIAELLSSKRAPVQTNEFWTESWEPQINEDRDISEKI